MSLYVPKPIRKLVIARAGNRCEYCRIPQFITNYDFHLEHVIGIQHGGDNSPDNLAWCCSFCNWKKGPNISTVLNDFDEVVPLFNPRRHVWFEHFESRDGFILGKSKHGLATVKLLEFNIRERVEIRSILSLAGFYP